MVFMDFAQRLVRTASVQHAPTIDDRKPAIGEPALVAPSSSIPDYRWQKVDSYMIPFGSSYGRGNRKSAIPTTDIQGHGTGPRKDLIPIHRFIAHPFDSGFCPLLWG
jgi:hypothetical protein